MSVPKMLSGSCPRCGGNGQVVCVNPAWLRQRRLDAKLTLRGVATALGFSAPYLSDIELGRRAVPKRVYEAYCALERGQE